MSLTPKPHDATLEDMGEELYQKLLDKQDHCFKNIKQLITNYNKDSGSRKTLEYLNSRLNILETHWSEFKDNHKVLLKSPNADDKYFEYDIYSVAHVWYTKAKKDMQERKRILETGRSGNQDQETEELQETEDSRSPPQEPRSERGELSAEYKKLLRQQQLNFSAFEQNSNKIQVEAIKEKWELEDRLQGLKSKWEAIDKIHWELDYELKGVQRSQYLLHYDQCESRYDELKRSLNEKIWSSIHFQKTTPKMEIPVFTGDYKQWVSFRDLFEDAIHLNPLLTKSQKMQHLKTKLAGEAVKLIQHLNISADNYDSAWNIITHRYENKRLLFSSYVNALLNLPQIQQPTAQTIKKLHDTLLECMNGLQNLEIDTTNWDPLIVHLLLPKLDADTYSDYIHDLKNPRDLPCLDEFMKFLEAKFMAFEAVKQNLNPQKTNVQQNKSQQRFNYFNERGSTNFKKPEKWTKSFYATVKTCPLCNYNHPLMRCKSFLEANVKKRNEIVAKTQLCRNCLHSHGEQKCISSKSCKVCQQAHHTLLHDDLHNKTSQPNAGPQPSSSRVSNVVSSEDQEVLLTTVQLRVKNVENNYITLRALLDQGSQVTLVTENAAQRLRLPRRKINAVVSGVGAALGNCKGLLAIECKSIHSDYTFETEALILNKLIKNLPNTTLKSTKWDHLENLKLADPEYNVPGPIDILLGADIYSKIIDEGVLRRDLSSPVAQLTKLGWILSGSVKTFNCSVTLNEIETISKFWETEEISSPNQQLTESGDICEQHYLTTTERTPTGQYVVKMPLKSDITEKLGNSKPQAIAQFLQLERKMAKQEHFAKLYKAFIQEYIELGHMKPAAVNTANNKLEAYLPHHGVLRESSTTTKLRTVFNASMPTSSKYSLNDLMEKGPNLQKDILLLILSWRTYKYALTADIEKMFRAILLNKEQQSLQKIIWRFAPSDPIQEWQLCTVTYGTKAAPYLAMRTLLQLAIDEGGSYPQAERTLRNHFYMDDVITGHDTVEDAKELQKQLYCLLQRGGFTLRKWACNDPTILQDLTEHEKSQEHIFNFKQDEPTKTLGLGWNTERDAFCFNLSQPAKESASYTKRRLLSEISKIYDPLGWIAPLTIKMKLLFQRIWSDELQWDDAVPTNIQKEWDIIRNDLHNLKSITIPRWIHVTQSQTIELHGFCDASEKAYSCVIYSRTVNNNGKYVITQLAAKTKVAPMKNKTSLPRLELCGAQLLAKLIEKVKIALSDHTLKMFCWTDSQVVLAWLQGNNTKWERYITNRTAHIKSIVPADHWFYVKTKENPADCATRGLLASQLITFNLWWEGPQWLKTWEEKKSKETFTTENGRVLECYVVKTQNCNGGEIIKHLLERCSTLVRVTRCLAWVLRCKTLLRHEARSAGTDLTLT